MEREIRRIGPEPLESWKGCLAFIERYFPETLETAEAVCIPFSCVPDSWYEINGFSIFHTDLPTHRWGTALDQLPWPVRERYKGFTQPHVEQFGAMLFDDEDVPRPAGYLALLEMEKRVESAREDAYEDLRERALQTWEDQVHVPTFEDVREMQRRIDEDSFVFLTSSPDLSPVLRLKWFTYISLSGAVDEYLHISMRHEVLIQVLEEFARYGRRLKDAAPLGDAVEGIEPFDLHVDAIKQALHREDAESIQSNAELYRLAADVGRFGYAEPYNTILKSVRRHFERRHGQAPPSSPEKWRRFLIPGDEPAEAIRYVAPEDLSPEEHRRRIEQIEAEVISNRHATGG